LELELPCRGYEIGCKGIVLEFREEGPEIDEPRRDYLFPGGISDMLGMWGEA